MNVKVFKKEKSALELQIEVSPQELTPYENRALQKIGAELELPGFRKGKAPIALVRKQVEPAKLLEKTAEAAIPIFYSKAILENKIEAIGSPKIELTKLAPGNALEFKALVTILPDFTLPDYKKIKLAKKEVKIKPDEVEHTIRILQRQHAKENEVQRAAQMGDAAEIDFNISQKKVPLEHGQGFKHPLIIGDGLFIPGFEEELVGLKAGQEKDFVVTFPKNYGKKSLANQKADVHVKMLKVKERNLPELTDEFVKKLGHFKNVEDFKSKIRENLEHEATHREQERFESEMLTTLAEKTEIEIPALLLQGEIDKMANELEQSLIRQGANLKDYLTSINKSLEDLKKSWSDQAKKRVKIGLLIRKIAKKENIQVEQKEVEDEINAVLRQNPANKAIEKALRVPAYQDYIKEVIRNRKTLKLLSSYAGLKG